MNTRPYLFSFSACVAGVIATGPLVSALVFGWPSAERAAWWLLSVVPVFALAAARMMHLENRAAAARHANEQEQLRVSVAERWAALEARLEQAVTATDDDALDTAQLPRLQREREFQVAHWHVYFQRIVQAGEAYGWDIRTLTAATSPYKVTTAPGWNLATGALAAAGYLAKDKTGTRLLVSVSDWKAERLWLNVTCPAGEPPDIAPPPYTATNSTQNNRTTAAGAVVEGEVVSR